ncbi:MAG: alpha/beta hydrolase [Burkholderiales bacterium RIFCSPLOWO2_02_FULL_57_36]|nr:MAG: alpha/beta hydrolase [Burkholderiales bacterium RIFCSPLOWO2_02_FULL_57_36]
MIDATWIDSMRLHDRTGKIATGWAAHTRPDVRFVEVERAIIRARVAGVASAGKPTVVIVCDPPSVLEHFDQLIALLEPHARVVVFEPPGFGFSCPKRNFRFTFDEYLHSIEQLLDALDEGPYLLAFSCVWAHIALQIATRTPDKVAKLMLWQCPSWEQQVDWAKFVSFKGILTRPVLGQAVMAWATNRMGFMWYKNAMAKNRYSEFVPTFQAALARGAFWCLGSLWQKWFSGYAPPPVRIRQPVLMTWGCADRTHRHSDKHSIGAQIPHAIWHSFFEHAGHSPELEASEPFAKLVLAWMDGGNVSPQPTVATAMASTS